MWHKACYRKVYLELTFGCRWFPSQTTEICVLPLSRLNSDSFLEFGDCGRKLRPASFWLVFFFLSYQVYLPRLPQLSFCPSLEGFGIKSCFQIVSQAWWFPTSSTPFITAGMAILADELITSNLCTPESHIIFSTLWSDLENHTVALTEIFNLKANSVVRNVASLFLYFLLAVIATSFRCSWLKI